ncbi:LysR family transcriptional regulator [Streptomyces sp. Ru87]|nr:LysR family transcriptional regulator [Streptomyces sp. Ru87]
MIQAVDLEVRHLRALCAIADTGSVRKAAVQLGMTQPSLTTQLRRIEKAVGGTLFTRGRTGSRPTPLGRSILGRARPIVAEMSALMNAVREVTAQDGGARLRLGGTGSRAVVGWLRRLHARFPETETSIHIDVSANELLQMLADNQLDVAFVQELEGFPLRLPAGVGSRVLIAREPQFIAMSDRHPAAARTEVALEDVSGDPWMVDPTVDDEYAAIRRLFATAGMHPRVVQVHDNTTAADLVASGEAVSPCQPTSVPRHGMVIRPLRDDPLAVRLLLVFRTVTAVERQLDGLYDDLGAAYTEVAWANAAYRRWLLRHDSPLLLRHGTPWPGAEELADGGAVRGLRDVSGTLPAARLSAGD